MADDEKRAKKTSISITDEALSMLESMMEAYGLSRSAVLEMIIRQTYHFDELTQRHRNSRKRPRGR